MLAVLGTACGDSDGEGGVDGGTPEPIPKAGSAEAEAQQELCEPFEACGGDVVGSWKVAAVCFENPALFLPATAEPDCADVVREAHARAAGRYQFSEDGKQTVDLRLELDLDTLWTDACVATLSGDDTTTAAGLCEGLEQQYADQSDIASASCELDGDDCACLLSTVRMSEANRGNYVVEGDAIGSSPYCVEGDTLRLSMTAMGLTGTIVMERE
jgi:hypothetical protein